MASALESSLAKGKVPLVGLIKEVAPTKQAATDETLGVGEFESKYVECWLSATYPTHHATTYHLLSTHNCQPTNPPTHQPTTQDTSPAARCTWTSRRCSMSS